MRVILGLLAWSLLEIALFVVIGGAIGVWATWGVVLGSGILGVAVLRRAGVSGRGLQPRDIAGPLAHGLLRGLGGVLLILPGFFTDLLGLALLVPALRERLITRLKRHFRMERFEADIIDGEAVEVEAIRIEKPSGWTKP